MKWLCWFKHKWHGYGPFDIRRICKRCGKIQTHVGPELGGWLREWA